MIDARSSSDLPLTFTSPVLPFGATLNPSTGEFNWTPTYIQDGIYEIPFEVSDCETTVSFTMTIDVLAANAAPVFDSQNGWQALEGQQLASPVFSYAPDNPYSTPPLRNSAGYVPLTSQPPQPVPAEVIHDLPKVAGFESATMQVL